MLAAAAAGRAAERHQGTRGVAYRSPHCRSCRGSRTASMLSCRHRQARYYRSRLHTAEQQARRPPLSPSAQPAVIGERGAWRGEAAIVAATEATERQGRRPTLPPGANAERHRGARSVASQSRHRCHRRGGRAARTPADAAARRERRASSRGARCGVAKPPPLPSPRRPSSEHAGRRCRQAHTPSVIGEREA